MPETDDSNDAATWVAHLDDDQIRGVLVRALFYARKIMWRWHSQSVLSTTPDDIVHDAFLKCIQEHSIPQNLLLRVLSEVRLISSHLRRRQAVETRQLHELARREYLTSEPSSEGGWLWSALIRRYREDDDALKLVMFWKAHNSYKAQLIAKELGWDTRKVYNVTRRIRRSALNSVIMLMSETRPIATSIEEKYTVQRDCSMQDEFSKEVTTHTNKSHAQSLDNESTSECYDHPTAEDWFEEHLKLPRPTLSDAEWQAFCTFTGPVRSSQVSARTPPVDSNGRSVRSPCYNPEQWFEEHLRLPRPTLSDTEWQNLAALNKRERR